MSAFTLQDAEAAKITVIGDGSKGSQAVHDLVVAYQANRRSGTAHTKTRGEVAGTGKKMYRQKGTGNARHGDRGAPIFVGGGVAFGPRNRSYAKTVPKKVRVLALQRVLGEKINANQVFRADSVSIDSGKTKDFVAAVKGLTDASKVLIVGNFSDETFRAARNVKSVQLESADSVNVEQLLHANAIILLDDAIETLSKRTS